MRNVFVALVVLLFVTRSAEALALFRMPISAKVTERSADGKGWREQGVLDVTFVQSAGQFKAALAQDGWRFLHAVPVGGANMRSLYSWKRGNQTVTLMLWRIDVGKTGFSWGVSTEGK